ncbi:MAG: HAD family hydrolase [Gemmatimonadales bacterium]|nr:MAG: HAD family hydrolase [Gemmatimonadales bacterium]
MKRKLVLFDIDGTLLLTAGAGRRAITQALAEQLGAEPDFSLIHFDGKTDPQIIEELLVAAGATSEPAQGQIDSLCTRYLELLEGELDLTRGQTQLMPGVVELLERLDIDSTVVLGLLTGNLAHGADLKLRSANIDPSRFAVGAFGSDSARRPDLPAIASRRAEPLFGRPPHGEAVVIIGDTPADIECGAGIGARAIAVATGSFSLDELSAQRPYAAFPDLSATDRVLDAIFG